MEDDDDNRPPRKRPRPAASAAAEEKESTHESNRKAGDNTDNDTTSTPPQHGSIDFTLKVQDGQVDIPISPELSSKLQSSCAFFRNAFRHGTRESHSRIIAKPDWSRDTATAIVALLQHGRLASLQIPHDYRAFKEAVDQILVPIRIPHAVYGYNRMEDSPTTIQLITDTWKASTTFFTMDIACRQSQTYASDRQNVVWDELLKAGIVFVKHQQEHDAPFDSDTDNEHRSAGLEVELLPEPQEASDSTDHHKHNHPPPAPPPAPGPHAPILSVGSSAPLYIAVNHTCICLSESLHNSRRHAVHQMSNKPACMALPLYMGGLEFLRDQFSLEKYGTQLQILMIGTDNVPTVNMVRITAPLEDLKHVLEAATDWIAPVRLAKLCYLLLPEPSAVVVGQLLTACQLCHDNPGSVGWDLEKNQFCTLKTIRDTLSIIDRMVDPETPVAKTGTIRLVSVDMTSAPEWSAY